MENTPEHAGQSETERAVYSIKPGYPAVALINVLLQHYAVDFPKYRRNVNTSQALWGEWKVLYEDILTHMENVQKPDVVYQVQWDSFLKYTAAIDPLEEHLLDLQSDLSANEVSPIPTEDGVSATITFMGNWFNNRQELINAGKLLGTTSPYAALSPINRNHQAEIKRAIRIDDLLVLKELAEKINEHALDDDDILEIAEDDDDFVSDVKVSVEAIAASAEELDDDDFERMGQIIFALMGIYIPFIAHDKDEEDAHVISKDVWVAVKKFTEQTASFVEETTVTIAEFKQQWNEYEAVLLTALNAFALQMITLMRQASQVRRPFFGRTTGVIRMWEALTTSTGIQEENRASQRRSLTELLSDSQAVFAKTSQSIGSFAESADVDEAIEDKKAAYADLIARLEPMVNTYAPGKWIGVYQDYTTGATTDDRHLRKFREFAARIERVAAIRDT